MSAIGCAGLGWADGWRGRHSGWSGDIGRRVECTWLREGWRGIGRRAGRRGKGRKGEKGLECGVLGGLVTTGLALRHSTDRTSQTVATVTSVLCVVS